MTESKPETCPLCGQDNRCGNLAGENSCWCMALDIPVELLEKLPSEQRNKACICQACVNKFHENSSAE